MLHAIHDALLPAVMDRAVLLANHVLCAEPVALQRLRAHAGRIVRVQALGWPAFLPPLPPVDLRLTGAGLLERVDTQAQPAPAPDLHLGVDASQPAALAWGLARAQPPAVQVQGDATLAADVHWVVTEVHWDVAADLERMIGTGPAQVLAALAGQLARGLRQAWPAAPSSSSSTSSPSWQGAPPPTGGPGGSAGDSSVPPEGTR
jgi:ubiquinone biosynthesis protein UbiJ